MPRSEAAERLAREMSAALKLDIRASCRPVGDPRERHHRHLHVGRRAFLTLDLVRSGRSSPLWAPTTPTSRKSIPALYAASLAVVDSLEQAAEIGDLHHALAAGAVTTDHVHATLGEVLAGTKPGRRDATAVTLFDSTGMGLQDVAAAAAIYRRALAAGAGTRLSLT